MLYRVISIVFGFTIFATTGYAQATVKPKISLGFSCQESSLPGDRIILPSHTQRFSPTVCVDRSRLVSDISVESMSQRPLQLSGNYAMTINLDPARADEIMNATTMGYSKTNNSKAALIISNGVVIDDAYLVAPLVEARLILTMPVKEAGESLAAVIRGRKKA